MNAFRHLLMASGHQPPIGTWISSASPIVAEAVGLAGFDWGVVDMEHAPVDVMDLVHMLQALAATKMVPVVRVPWNDTVTVKRVLDAGATTILFPFVESAEEAGRAVAATRYPPEGVRGMATMSRATRYGTQANYAKVANQGMGVIVQLETAKAVARLEEIAAVPGVDALFIGPADLSASMGYVGQPSAPAVLDLMTQAARRAHDCGIPIGTLGPAPEHVVQYRAAGYDYVALSSDLGLLMRGAQAAVQALRTQEAGAHVTVHSLTGGTQTDLASA
jgi:2-keto-3-deoxy-L-rhamnonate aldolase RhmA